MLDEIKKPTFDFIIDVVKHDYKLLTHLPFDLWAIAYLGQVDSEDVELSPYSTDEIEDIIRDIVNEVAKKDESFSRGLWPFRNETMDLYRASRKRRKENESLYSSPDYSGGIIMKCRK